MSTPTDNQKFDPASEPDPDAVREFLARENGITTAQLESPPPAPQIPPVAGHAELDGTLADEDKRAVQEALHMKAEVARASAPEEPKVDIPISEHARTEHSPAKFNDLMDWLFHSDVIGEITVTPREQKLYGDALLTDDDLIWDLKVPYQGEHIVRTRGMSVSDQDTMNSALALDVKEKKVVEGMAMATRVQQYAMCLQVLSVDDIPCDRELLAAQDVELSVRVAKLREMREKVISRYKTPKLSLFIRAIMIYEAKIKLCHDHAANGTFS